ncbi:MAG: hypothetical protein ACXW2U_05385 [Telluria sp.]
MDATPVSTTFNINIAKAGQAIVTREIVFTNGNSITFSVAIDTAGLAVSEIHKKSVGAVIEQLQAWIAPQ